MGAGLGAARLLTCRCVQLLHTMSAEPQHPVSVLLMLTHLRPRFASLVSPGTLSSPDQLPHHAAVLLHSIDAACEPSQIIATQHHLRMVIHGKALNILDCACLTCMHTMHNARTFGRWRFQSPTSITDHTVLLEL